MTYIFAAIIGGLLIWVLIRYWWLQPAKHKNVLVGNLKPYFETLFNDGINSTFIIITERKNKRFIQFSKYVKVGNIPGLQFDFPLAEWSKEYYQPLQKMLESRGIQYELEKTKNEGISEFIVIDFKDNLDDAVLLAVLVLKEIYGLSDEDRVNIKYGNVWG